jgi:hypothetical protein
MTTTPTASPELPDLDHLEALARAANPGPWEWWTSNSVLRLSAADGIDGGVLQAYSHRGGSNICCGMSDRAFIAAANPAAVLTLIALARRAQPEGEAPQAEQPALTVWNGPMPESNGKSNFTAILMRKGGKVWDGITLDRSEYPDRVRYEADRVRYLLGEMAEPPFILDYDADKHSGYVEPAATLSPLCGAQHAESGKEVADKGIHSLLETLLRPYGVFDVAIVNAHAENQRDFFALKDRARVALAAQQAAAPVDCSEQRAEPEAWQVLEMSDQPDSDRLLDVVLTNGVMREGLSYAGIDWTQVADWRYSAPGTPEAPGEPEEAPIVTNQRAPKDLAIGDYVFASRWSDCDPGDPWAVGHVSEIGEGFVVVGDVTPRRFPCAMRITAEQGTSIIAHYPGMEKNYQPRNYRAIARVFGIAAQLDGGQEGSE